MDKNIEETITSLSKSSSNLEREIKNYEKEKETFKLTKNLIIKMIWCLSLSLFWVIFIWGIWSKGVYALGINAFIFWFFTLLLFIWVLYYKKYYQSKDLYWIIPLLLIAFSFLIYENPFIKVINIFIYPILIALFIIFGFLKEKENRHWDLNFVFNVISRIFSVVVKISSAFNLYFDLITPKNKKSKGIIIKTILGIVLFFIIALIFIIPLLSSADTVFAEKVDVIYNWIKEIISVSFIYKSIIFIIISVTLLSSLLAWGKRYDFSEKEESKKKIDSIISGIVLGGILSIYLLFLWIQTEKLWVGNLPFDFKDTENLVKSGFWQLFFLSGINTLIYFFTYRKTNIFVQRVLIAFTIASLLLLFSAGHRMALYVTYYGFSYEKFFASYTVIYSAILFMWLILNLFKKKRANVFKFLIFLFLWMFSVITILPVEQFILRTNVALSKKQNSRVRLFELTMLSPDVLSLVKKYQSEGVLKEKADYLERENEQKSKEDFDWGPWIEKQEKRIADKKWYEKNLINLIDE
ncbi:MAG: DUF4153 domain-containing protein [Patescibacteria group bacterium]